MSRLKKLLPALLFQEHHFSTALAQLGNGGLETLESYGSDMNSYIDNSMELKGEELIRKQFTRLLPFSHKNFFNQLQLNYEWGNYFFVHAGINPDFSLDKQEKETMLWTREQRFFDFKMTYHKIIVHGHTPVERVEKLPFRINIDTGAVFSNRLSCWYNNLEKVIYFDTIS